MADAYGEGASMREVAKHFKCSVSTVRAACRANGVTREAAVAKVAAAAETNRERNAAKRAALQSALLDDAERLRRQLWEPCTLHSFGGKENTHNSIDLDRPLFADQASITRAVGTFLQRANELDRHLLESSAGDRSKGLIERLVDGLTEQPDRGTGSHGQRH